MYMEHVREISEPFMRAKMYGDAASAEKWLKEDLPQVCVFPSVLPLLNILFFHGR